MTNRPDGAVTVLLRTPNHVTAGKTVVEASAKSFAWLGSAGVETWADELSTAAAAPGVTCTVMSGAAPTARLGLVQVTTPADCPQVQPDPDPPRKTTSAGRVWLTVTSPAASGPALVTARV